MDDDLEALLRELESDTTGSRFDQGNDFSNLLANIEDVQKEPEISFEDLPGKVVLKGKSVSILGLKVGFKSSSNIPITKTKVDYSALRELRKVYKRHGLDYDLHAFDSYEEYEDPNSFQIHIVVSCGRKKKENKIRIARDIRKGVPYLNAWWNSNRTFYFDRYVIEVVKGSVSEKRMKVLVKKNTLLKLRKGCKTVLARKKLKMEYGGVSYPMVEMNVDTWPVIVIVFHYVGGNRKSSWSERKAFDLLGEKSNYFIWRGLRFNVVSPPGRKEIDVQVVTGTGTCQIQSAVADVEKLIEKQNHEAEQRKLKNELKNRLAERLRGRYRLILRVISFFRVRVNIDFLREKMRFAIRYDFLKEKKLASNDIVEDMSSESVEFSRDKLIRTMYGKFKKDCMKKAFLIFPHVAVNDFYLKSNQIDFSPFSLREYLPLANGLVSVVFYNFPKTVAQVFRGRPQTRTFFHSLESVSFSKGGRQFNETNLQKLCDVLDFLSPNVEVTISDIPGVSQQLVGKLWRFRKVRLSNCSMTSSDLECLLRLDLDPRKEGGHSYRGFSKLSVSNVSALNENVGNIIDGMALLSNHKNLTTLNVSSNVLGRKGVEFLIANCAPQLRSLAVCGTRIHAFECILLLKSMKKLQRLLFNRNGCGGDFNNGSEDDGEWETKSLEYIDLTMCHASERLLREIFKAAKNLVKLKIQASDMARGKAESLKKEFPKLCF